MKLVVLDVEGTLFADKVRLPGTSIASTMWQAIAQALGESAILEEVETHRRWIRGEYNSYLEWVRDTIEIHRRHGLTQGLFETLISAAVYNPGAPDALLALDRARYIPVLVSGGFQELARRAQLDCAIHHSFAACEYFFDSGGTLKSYNLLPCDFEGKLDFIRLILREYRLGSEDWVFVGDGANDVPIAREAPLSVGYRPHAELQAVVSTVIQDFPQLLGILQG